MKKLVKLVCIIFIIFLVFEFILFLFKSNHEIEYKLENYKIKEIYDEGIYYIKISFKKNNFVFEVPNNFYKKKRIVNKVYSYKFGDTLCIYPALKNKDTNSNIVCVKDNVLSSYDYNKNNLSSFVKKLKKEGYNSLSWKRQSNKQMSKDTLKVYSNNINLDTYIYLYKYNGFYQITSDEIKEVNLFKKDSYNNPLGFIVSKYYVIPNYDEKFDYSMFYRIDMTNNKIKEIKLKNTISKDSYLNGIVDDEVYIFDRDELVQYKINPKKKKVIVVGNKKDKVLNYNLKFTKKDVYTFRDNDIKFKTIDDYIKKIEATKEINYIAKDRESYYYQTNDNCVYYYNRITKVKKLLFKMNISDFRLVNNTIYFISNNTLYSYSFTFGFRKIIVYNELSFNPENRIAIYSD